MKLNTRERHKHVSFSERVTKWCFVLCIVFLLLGLVIKAKAQEIPVYKQIIADSRDSTRGFLSIVNQYRDSIVYDTVSVRFAYGVDGGFVRQDTGYAIYQKSVRNFSTPIGSFQVTGATESFLYIPYNERYSWPVLIGYLDKLKHPLISQTIWVSIRIDR